ncbi:unnamed protein product [Linum trigynum]|uniref:Uncharacterized protein n=1 Tax=Linum trigynum TaxID=586398 RepID=A0AAV2DUQ0_9ROSI
MVVANKEKEKETARSAGQPTLEDDGGDEGSRGGEDGRQSGVGSGATRGDPKRRDAARGDPKRRDATRGDPERRRGAGKKEGEIFVLGIRGFGEGVRFRLCWGRGSGSGNGSEVVWSSRRGGRLTEAPLSPSGNRPLQVKGGFRLAANWRLSVKPTG